MRESIALATRIVRFEIVIQSPGTFVRESSDLQLQERFPGYAFQQKHTVFLGSTTYSFGIFQNNLRQIVFGTTNTNLAESCEIGENSGQDRA